MQAPYDQFILFGWLHQDFSAMTFNTDKLHQVIVSLSAQMNQMDSHLHLQSKMVWFEVFHFGRSW